MDKIKAIASAFWDGAKVVFGMFASMLEPIANLISLRRRASLTSW